MTANTAPLVTRQALQAFTQRLVKNLAPEQVILFGSQARGEARWDSDADILVVMPFEGRPQDTVKGMRNACEPAFSLDLHLRRPDEITPRYRWGDPFIREALNHLETYLRAALIAQGVDSRKCRDLQILSDRLRVPIPGWQPNPETLNTLTLGAIAYLPPCEGHPEPTQDGAWAIAHAGPLRLPARLVRQPG
jgi:predicted nucleotidyltransferase